MNFFPSASTTRRVRSVGIAAIALAVSMGLAACGGAAPGAASDSTGGGSSSGGTVVSTTLKLGFVDSSGATVTNLSGSSPVYAVAMLTKGSSPVVGASVVFAASVAGLVTFDPLTQTALTDSTGKAVIAMSAGGSSSGATIISAVATTTGDSSTASASYTATGGIQVNGVTASSLSLDPTLVLSPTTVSAYGTSTVTATVLSGGSPYTGGAAVSFTQGCGNDATITSSAVSQTNGKASVTFTDAGCGVSGKKNVLITAALGSSIISNTLTVNSPSSGSLMFTAVSPASQSILLNTTGGIDRQEYATLTFKVVDLAGKAVPNVPVCFNASTYTGALKLDGFYYLDDTNKNLPAKTVSDDSFCGSATANKVRLVKSTSSDGTVQVQILSGTTPTPVEVLASTYYPVGSTTLLSTSSSKLTISNGKPFQRGFDLSIDKSNIDGFEFSGETATVTARLRDWFGNPVPDGTTVNMITSGGAICSSSAGSCTTLNGACSCTLVTQEPRPADGRVVVLAYAKGYEDYVDSNGNNTYNAGVDSFSTLTQDLPDAYLDTNKNDVFDLGRDVGIPVQGTGSDTSIYATGDGVWSAGGVDVRRDGIVYFSKMTDPTLIFVPDGNRIKYDSATGSYYISLKEVADCSGASIDEAVIVGYLDDGQGNPLAAGTDVSVSDRSSNVSAEVTNGSSVAAIGLRAPSVTIDGSNVPKSSINVGTDPTLVSTKHAFKIKGIANACTGSGSATISIKTPKGVLTPARILFRSVNASLPSTDTRATDRSTLPVKYEARP